MTSISSTGLITATLAAAIIPLAAAMPAQAEVYDFKFVSGGQKIPAITGAGSSIFVEVTENLTTPADDVLFTFSSQIAEPEAVLVRFWFDTGLHSDLFSGLSVYEQSAGVNIVPRTPATWHPYVSTLNPDYMFGLSNVFPLSKDIYGVHPNGEYLTLSATLGNGKSFADVIDAMNEGVTMGTESAGLRLGVLVYHLLGPRIDPKVTLMDDAGFVTGSLVPVPEPETWAMMLAGLCLTGLMARYRKA